jgi:hypothetical protein
MFPLPSSALAYFDDDDSSRFSLGTLAMIQKVFERHLAVAQVADVVADVEADVDKADFDDITDAADSGVVD